MDDLRVGSENMQGTARQRLASALEAAFRARNYALAYLARRCRTYPGRVQMWTTGDRVPEMSEWTFLLSVSKEFDKLSRLWEEAREEAPATPENPLLDPMVDAAPAPLEASPASPDGGEGTTSASPDGGEGTTSVTSPLLHLPLTESTVGSPSAQHIPVPADFVVYACKIGRGRIIQLPLPIVLTRNDVDRLHAFLLTQVDDSIDEAR